MPKGTIGDRIKYYRKEHGLSQRKIAMLLRVDQPTVRDWERNNRKPNKDLFDRCDAVVIKNLTSECIKPIFAPRK